MPLNEQDFDRIYALSLAAAHKAATELGYAWAADRGGMAQAVVDKLGGNLAAAIAAQLQDVAPERIEAAVRAGIGQAFAAAGEAAGTDK